MAVSYFEYALSNCRRSSIRVICSIDSTREALLERATQEFNGCNNITHDYRLLKAINTCLQNLSIIARDQCDKDAKTIYDRCIDFFNSSSEIVYESCFDHLVELNWLLASIWHAKRTCRSNVTLLIDNDELLDAIKSYLFDLYHSAVQDNNECVYIKEALQARNKIFSGLHSFQYDESKKYTSQNYSTYDLKQIENDYRKESIRKMALFYGLTATAALAENIRRFY